MPATVFVDLIEVPEPKSRKLLGPTRARWQAWRWVARNADNQKKLARSSERYTNKFDCLKAIEQLFGPHTTVFLRQAETGNVPLRMAAE